MADATALFKKKIGPLPAGVWLLIIVAGVGVGLYIKRKAVPDEEAGEIGEEAVAGEEVVPYDSLPSEDYGAFPVTGGGAPVVASGALHLSTEPIRIIVQNPPRPHRCPAGKHWDKKRKRCVRNRT